MYITKYHKAMAFTGQYMVIAQFLPPTVLSIVFNYIAFVIPFRQLLYGKTGLSTLLFVNNMEVEWSDSIMLDIIQTQLQQVLGKKLLFSEWRHFVIAATRSIIKPSWLKARGGPVSKKARVNHNNSSDLDNSDNEKEDDNDIFDLQAAHSSRTAESVYGRSADSLLSLTTRNMTLFEQISTEWHQFLHLESKFLPTTIATTSRSTTNAHNLITPLQIQNVLKGLQISTYKCPKQGTAIDLLFIKQCIHTIVVLPTGGGKSLLYQLCAILYPGKFVIVIIPFVALLEDAILSCGRKGLLSAKFSQMAVNAGVRLLFIPVEAVSSYFTMKWMRSVENDIAGVFIDEAHLIVTETSYRPALRDLHLIRQLSCPIHLLTATLAVGTMEQELQDALLLDNATIIRSSIRRPNLQIEFKLCTTTPFMLDKIKQLLEIELKSGGQAIVFAKTRKLVEYFATKLQRLQYHAGMEESIKTTNLQIWANKQSGSCICATKALGAGIDIPDIRLIVHVNYPDRIIDYTQEIG